MRKWLFSVIMILILLFLLCIGMIHYIFNQKQYPTARLPQQEHWIHRGLYDNKKVFENTIAAFDSARSKDIKGIELDIFYVDSLNDFVVTHDMPNKYALPTLLLSEVVDKYDSSFSYWLDLKNLGYENMALIAAKLYKILPLHLRQKAFIESANAAPLSYLAEKGFNTIYWIQYSRTNFLKKLYKTTLIKWNFIQYKFAGGTMAASMTDEDFFESFRAVPKYIFHIYTPELYNKVKNQPNIAVYLMDYIPAE